MHSTSDQLQMFAETTSEKSTPTQKSLSLLAALAKISHWLEKEKGWKEKEVALSWKQLGLLLKFNQIF